MQKKLTNSQRLFYLGLLAMLLFATLSAAAWPLRPQAMALLTLAAAVVTAGARLRYHLLHRAGLRDFLAALRRSELPQP
ncbi:MAG TPA: hypothetical protein VHS06_03585 [Chloroflexota bacterium]|nr:hypothetical protein [Chloroflexota bacterium]